MEGDLDASDTIADLSDAILAEIGPMIEELDTGIIISALIDVTTKVAMVGLNCDQATAIKLIAATFEAAAIEVGPTEH